MARPNETTIRILLVDDRVEDAEAVVSALRNGGIAVRPTRPEHADALLAALAQPNVDLVLANVDAKVATLDDVARAVAGSGKDLPLLLLADRLDDDTALLAVECGARGIALRGHAQHLQRMVRREFEDLEARRALRRLESQLRESERRCDALIDSSRDPIAYVHEGMHIRANRAYLDMFGYDSFEDVEGMSLLDLVAADRTEDFKQLLKRMAKGEAPPPQYEVDARHLDGETFPAIMEFTAASYEGESCLQVVFRRRETDPELAREVEELRQRDPATGLLNRPTFLHRLELAIADTASSGERHGLLLLEPDHYQRLLQDIGLDSADAIIAGIGARLSGALDAAAAAARFGEHSLAVLLPGSDHAGTQAAAERIRAAFAAEPLAIGERSSPVTVSIGGVQISERIASVPQVLAKASHSTQSAIGMGGDRIEIFDPGAADRAEEERIRGWVDRLRDATAHDHFVLHYQPVIALDGSGQAAYEALLRLDAGGDDLVMPAVFLQIAEEHDLLADIDRWVVGHALAVIAERERAGKPTSVYAKITPASLADDRLLQLIGARLAELKVPGERLVLELPEAKVFTHLAQARRFLEDVATLGVRLCLEQFGAGLNSFQLLGHFRPNLLKIDRSFMSDLARQADNQQQITDITRKAHDLGVQCIAEFVEDAASMTILFSAGVDYVQGYFLGPATSAMSYDF
jgi:diguanylate cyclase (GGDEF)-like protein/PAS domain S-box-containing protein